MFSGVDGFGWDNPFAFHQLEDGLGNINPQPGCFAIPTRCFKVNYIQDSVLSFEEIVTQKANLECQNRIPDLEESCVIVSLSNMAKQKSSLPNTFVITSTPTKNTYNTHKCVTDSQTHGHNKRGGENSVSL
jgi:hypothetical protein